MSGILKADPSVTTKYEVTPDQLKKLIAADLGAPVEKVRVDYVEGQLPNAHPMDRDPPRGIVKIVVTVTS